MDKIVLNKTQKKIVDLYKQIITKNELTNYQILQYLKYICNMFKWKYSIDCVTGILADCNNVKKIKGYLEKIEKYYRRPNLYYNNREAADELGVKEYSVNNYAKKGVIKEYIYIKNGTTYSKKFLKEEIDKYANIIKATVAISKIPKLYDLNVSANTIIEYVEKNDIKKITNPLQLYNELRIYKDDAKNIVEFYSLKRDQYYSIEEIIKKYNLKIAKKPIINSLKSYVTDIKKHKRRKQYFNKVEVNRVMEIRKDSLTIKDLEEKLGIARETVMRIIKDNDIEYIVGNNSLFKVNAISKVNYEKVVKIYTEKNKLLNKNDDYDKFKYLIKDIIMNTNASDTISLYNEFTIEKYNKIKDKRLVTRELSWIYINIISLLKKEIFKYQEKGINNLIKSITKVSVKTKPH